MGWLINYILSAGGFRKPNEEDFEAEETELQIGLHIFVSDDYRFVPDVSIDKINRAVHLMEWSDNFCQIMCTAQSGISVEVSGWLGIEGLSGVYRNRPEGIHEVTTNPPENIDQVIDLLSLFLTNSGDWHKKYFSKK